MKKLSIIFTSFIAVLYFISTFFSIGNENFRKTIDSSLYFRNHIEDNSSVRIQISPDYILDEQVKQDLYDVVSKNHTIAHGVLMTKGAESEDYIVYVYAEQDIYKDQIYTKNNERIDFSNPEENRFYTTQKQENGIVIDFLNPMYYEYSNPYYFHPFHQMEKIPYLFYMAHPLHMRDETVQNSTSWWYNLEA